MCAALQAMNDCLMALAVEGTGDAKGDFLCVKKLFDEREQIRQKEISDAGRHLTHAFEFLARVFGEGNGNLFVRTFGRLLQSEICQ